MPQKKEEWISGREAADWHHLGPLLPIDGAVLSVRAESAP